MKTKNSYEGISIPTYVINIKERTDRLEHIKNQFKDKPEFDVVVLEACKHEIGAVGLWHSVLKMIKFAQKNDDDVIIMCEDDHEFTEHYGRDFLIEQIIEGNDQGLNLLFGGVAGFNQVIRITPNKYWADSVWSTQFVIIYKKFFEAILNEPYGSDIVADGRFSEMTSSKMILYPFISIQKDFGYSDATTKNNENKGFVEQLFRNTILKMNMINSVYNKYCKF